MLGESFIHIAGIKYSSTKFPNLVPQGREGARIQVYWGILISETNEIKSYICFSQFLSFGPSCPLTVKYPHKATDNVIRHPLGAAR